MVSVSPVEFRDLCDQCQGGLKMFWRHVVAQNLLRHLSLISVILIFVSFLTYVLIAQGRANYCDHLGLVSFRALIFFHNKPD